MVPYLLARGGSNGYLYWSRTGLSNNNFSPDLFANISHKKTVRIATMMESAHSSIPQSEAFEDPFADLTDSTSNPASGLVESSENPLNDGKTSEEEDPWAV